MKRLFSIPILLAILSWITTSCVHEFPELDTSTEFTLHLNFDTELPLYKEVTYATSRTIGDASAYDVRHIVSVHRIYPDGSYNRTADTTIVFTCDDVENLNCSRKLRLREGKYDFFVWTDFVDEGSQADKFYTPSDFAEIILHNKNSYTGSCDFRDAFRGSAQGSVTIKTEENMVVENEVTVSMKRPLAKFRFISTDYDEFAANVLAKEEKKNSAANTTGEDAQTRNINPDDYRVVFHYVDFVPCSYNMFTDKPADSWTGLQFDSSLKPIGNGEIEMGFDYVFVNGAEAGVSVIIAVYDKDGQLVSSTPAINVPLKRSLLTTVRGKFLTSTSNGGIDINPSFDGEYNIMIR